MFSLDIVELDQGVPHDRVRGDSGDSMSLHPSYCQEVPLRTPLDLHIWRGEASVTSRSYCRVSLYYTVVGFPSTLFLLTTANCFTFRIWLAYTQKIDKVSTFESWADDGRSEVIVVVHQTDVSWYEADCQKGLQDTHLGERNKHISLLANVPDHSVHSRGKKCYHIFFFFYVRERYKTGMFSLSLDRLQCVTLRWVIVIRLSVTLCAHRISA